MHFCAVNTNVEIAPLKSCAEIAMLYLIVDAGVRRVDAIV